MNVARPLFATIPVTMNDDLCADDDGGGHVPNVLLQ